MTTTPKELRLGNHYNWRVGQPIPPAGFVESSVEQLSSERGGHWLVKPHKGRRWHHADTMQTMVRWRRVTFNAARVVIAHARFNGENPPFHKNVCGAPECVNPAHWEMPVRKTLSFVYVLEQRPVGFVVTHGGRWPNKDLVVYVGKTSDDIVHILRVVVNDHEQKLQVLCGAPLDDQHLIVSRDATCIACIS